MLLLGSIITVMYVTCYLNTDQHIINSTVVRLCYCISGHYLSAAFTTVDHGILLDVLNKQFGVSGTALKWLDSYLHPGDCKANVNGSYSLSRPLKFMSHREV